MVDVFSSFQLKVLKCIRREKTTSIITGCYCKGFSSRARFYFQLWWQGEFSRLIIFAALAGGPGKERHLDRAARWSSWGIDLSPAKMVSVSQNRQHCSLWEVFLLMPSSCQRQRTVRQRALADCKLSRTVRVLMWRRIGLGSETGKWCAGTKRAEKLRRKIKQRAVKKPFARVSRNCLNTQQKETARRTAGESPSGSAGWESALLSKLQGVLLCTR